MVDKTMSQFEINIFYRDSLQKNNTEQQNLDSDSDGVISKSTIIRVCSNE